MVAPSEVSIHSVNLTGNAQTADVRPPSQHLEKGFRFRINDPMAADAAATSEDEN